MVLIVWTISQAHDVTLWMSYTGPGFGLGDPDGAFPAQCVLWFCDYKAVLRTTVQLVVQ